MSDFVAKYWYLLLGVAVGGIAIWITIHGARRDPEAKHGRMGYFIWGPFWPSFSDYWGRRGGLTRREFIGWAVVVLVAVIAILVTPGRGS